MTSSLTDLYVCCSDRVKRNALARNLRRDHHVQTFQSAEDLLCTVTPGCGACVIVDHEAVTQLMKDVTLLSGAKTQCAIVMMTHYAEALCVAEGLRGGKLEVLDATISSDSLRVAIQQVLTCWADKQAQQTVRRRISDRLTALTPREREVLVLVRQGKHSKQIGRQLGISASTVDVHRSNIALKMRVDSVSDLVPLLSELSVPISSDPTMSQHLG